MILKSTSMLFFVLFLSVAARPDSIDSQSALEQAYIETSNASMITNDVTAFWDMSIKDVVGRPASNSKQHLLNSFSKMNFSLDILRRLILEKHKVKIQHFPHRLVLQKGSKPVISFEDAKAKVMNLCKESFASCTLIYAKREEAPFDSRGQILGLPYYEFAFINVLGKTNLTE